MVVLDSLQILVPRPGIQPVPPALGKLIVLTTGPPGKPEEIQIFLKFLTFQTRCETGVYYEVPTQTDTQHVLVTKSTITRHLEKLLFLVHTANK